MAVFGLYRSNLQECAPWKFLNQDTPLKDAAREAIVSASHHDELIWGIWEILVILKQTPYYSQDA